jgi:hypothetical protein
MLACDSLVADGCRSWQLAAGNPDLLNQQDWLLNNPSNWQYGMMPHVLAACMLSYELIMGLQCPAAKHCNWAAHAAVVLLAGCPRNDYASADKPGAVQLSS